jgi:caa(3)-type oxidase subunit IV
MIETTEASTTRRERSLYITIWACLVLLLAAGLIIFVLPLPRSAAVIAIFSLAVIKSALVLRHYMHLKHEHLLIYLIIGTPALLFLGMAIALVPDIVYRHSLGLK